MIAIGARYQRSRRILDRMNVPAHKWMTRAPARMPLAAARIRVSGVLSSAGVVITSNCPSVAAKKVVYKIQLRG